MDGLLLCVILILAASIPTSYSFSFGPLGGVDDDNYDEDYDNEEESTTTLWKPNPSPSDSVCVPVPLGGVEWILSVRHSDYGWKEDTHRAVVALAINKWGPASEEDIKQMEMQLEVELAKRLLQNGTSAMHPTDLALYIHALIAMKRNPHDFYGIDLVSRLEKVVDTSLHHPHPFLLLALCNAKRFTAHHLHKALTILQREKSGDNMNSLALALNAYECAGTLDHPTDTKLINEVRNKLIEQQDSDGSFGNVYQTSLVSVALASAQWSKRHSAIEYLKQHLTVDVNMVSAYLIQLALNAQKVHFIKDLYPDLKLTPIIVQRKGSDQFIQYSLKSHPEPEVYHTITIRVAPNMNFFDIMQLSAEHDSKFNFSYINDKENNPNVYSISGVSNDAEQNLYWRLCLQSDIDHNRHNSTVKTIRDSPKTFVPKRDEHVIYWYRNTDCESK